MLFNPVFINSTQSTQGSTKQNNFLGTSYLFSDIIKIYSTEGNTNPLKEYSNFPESKNIFSIKGLFELKNSESLLEIINPKLNLASFNNPKNEIKPGNNLEEALKLTETDLTNFLYSLNYYSGSETGQIKNENEKTDFVSYPSKETTVIFKIKEILKLLDGQNKVSLYLKEGNNNYKLDINPQQTELSQDSNNYKLASSNNNLESLAENAQFELKSGTEVNSNLTFGGEKLPLTDKKTYEIKLTPLPNQAEEPEFIYFDNKIEDELTKKATPQKNISEETESETNLKKGNGEFSIKEIFSDPTPKQETNISKQETNISKQETNISKQETNISKQETNSLKQETNVLDSHLKKFGSNFSIKSDETEIKFGKSQIVENNLKTTEAQNSETTKIISSYKNEVAPNSKSLDELGKIIKNYSNKDFEVRLDKSANEIETNPETSLSRHTESQKDIHALNFELGKNIKESIVKSGIKDLSFKQETKNSPTKQPDIGNKNNLVQETRSTKRQLNNFEPPMNVKENKIIEESENQNIKRNNIPIKEAREEEHSTQIKVKDNTSSNPNEKLTTEIDTQSKSSINNSEADKNFSPKEHSEAFRSTKSEIKEENDNSSNKVGDKIESNPEKNPITDDKTKLNAKSQEEIKPFKEVSSNMNSEGESKPEPLHISSENLRSFSKETGSLNTNRLTETFKNIPVSEVANEISSLIQKGEKKSLTLQLQPETLGKVKVVLDMLNKQVTARIEVENETAKQAVLNNLEHLKEAIHNQGIQLNSVFVSLSNEDQKQHRTQEIKKKSNHISSEKKIEEQSESKTLKKMGYNTYEYLA